jgi:hypothetical protein
MRINIYAHLIIIEILDESIDLVVSRVRYPGTIVPVGTAVLKVKR